MQIRINKINIISLLIAFLGLVIFTQTAIFANKSIFVFMGLILAMSFFYYYKSSLVDRKLLFFLLFFITPTLIGIVSLPISYYFENTRFNYEELNLFGRLFNVFILSFLILFIHKYTNTKDPGLFFRWYKYGLFILMLTALWHALSIHTNFIDFPFDTRSHLHSAYGHDYSFSGRVTGLASEPSYFVMFTIDFIILLLIFNKGLVRNILIVMTIILLILSLSPSGYISFFGAFAGAYFLTEIKFIKRLTLKQIIVMLFLIFLSIFSAFYLLSIGVLDYIIGRITNPEMLQSARAYMSYMPFVWSSESNMFSFLFGHGVKSYSIIGTAFNVPGGNAVDVTSNNFYVDTFWEAGLIGLLILMSFFIYLFKKIFKSKFGRLQVFIMFFIFFDLFLSGVFRADFASMRYFIMLYLLYVLLHNDYKTLQRIK